MPGSLVLSGTVWKDPITKAFHGGFILFSVLTNKHMFESIAVLEPWIVQNTFKQI